MAGQTTEQARTGFLDDFRRREHELVGHDRPWLAKLRRDAIERFTEIGFPGPKDEAWKYTSVGPLLREPSRAVAGDAAPDVARVGEALAALAGFESGDTLAVFVDGRFDERLSHLATPGATIESLGKCLSTNGEALAQDLGRYADSPAHGFAALNTAFATDGAVVRLARGAAVERAIHVVFYSSRRAEQFVVHPRVLIVAEQGSSARVVEHWVGEAGARYLSNGVTEIALARDSTVEHVKLQRESDEAFHVHRIQVRQQQASSLRSHAVALGGAVSRTEITTVLAGEHAECSLFGLYVMDGRRHVDHHTTIDHSAPHTTSRELYKGILDDRSRGVFTGKVFVRSEAQQTSAEQTNRNLLLADGAIVEARPQLEIYADDVKCTHGAAVGRLDDDALFYMRQRGIGLVQARSLLTYAFATEVLETLSIRKLRRDLERSVLQRIARGDGPMLEMAESIA
jgi:Fe-S cluster assembly protein SufD